MNATDKQIDYIITLAGKAQGGRIGYLSQITAVHLNQRQKKGSITKAEASALIDELKAL